MKTVVAALALALVAAAFALEGAVYMALAVPHVDEAPFLVAGTPGPSRSGQGQAACSPEDGGKC